ncbi:UDP-N-acetylmuramoyl-tripeptide--D-alanyl-D-alanine ligase [Citreimonas salinaria]|nr:UDP-N-acetylmuramoyl-tripeptide--D-alanyl-D-alanine ligase [Citreimonas salinaria]
MSGHATLWTSADAAAATGGRATAAWSATGVSIDTRTIEPGDLFVALTSARDGHDFVVDALAKGAAAALVSRVPDGLPDDAPLLVVDDVQRGLEALGRAGRARFTGRVVAVTGSVGKTSTKEMLRTLLGALGRVHAAEKSYNNHWGVPLTLARMPADADFAVIEIGMNAPGEIAPLSRLARPHVAVVTIVAPAHLAAFDDLSGIAHEKAAIFDGLEPGGTAVLRGDLEVSDVLRARAQEKAASVVDFGEAEGQAYRMLEARIGDDCTVVTGLAPGDKRLFKVMVPGRHFAVNAMGVLAVADALDLDPALAVTALGQWRAGAGRGAREVIHLDPVATDLSLELIDDAYNSNPASLAASLEVLAAARTRDGLGKKDRGRRIAYLGDMKELGATEGALHAGVADLPAMRDIDVVHCIGPLMRHLWEALPERKRGRCCDSAAEASTGLASELDAGDVVLVKGSQSVGLARVVDAIRKMGHAPAGGDL